jgi:membrane protein DedA with SNARE-associated domain
MTAHLTNWIADHGLLAVFVLMAVDAVLPAGGELVMLFAGALAAGAISGHSGPSLVAAIAAGTLGYLAGSLAGWALGRAGGRAFVERYGRWLHLGPPRLVKAERWFARYGAAFVFFGRLTPLVRSFVSIPAGVLEFPLARYALLTALASLAWCAAFGIAGHALGANWDSVHHAFRYVDYAAVVAIVAIVGALLIRRRRSVAT